MSYKVTALVYSRRFGSPPRKQVIAYMADRASESGEGVFCSKATIAADTELCRTAVYKAINELLKMGVIVAAGKRRCRNGYTIIYDLDLDAIASLPHSVQPVCQADRSAARTRAPDTPVREADPHPSTRQTPTRPADGPKPSLEPSINHGGGDARERDGHIAQIEIFPPASKSDGPTFRERMLDAMGADPSGTVNTRPTSLGSRVDMTLAERWKTDLNLSEDTILAVVNETMAQKRDGPPTTFRYFTPAMQREAARQAEAPLQPANLNEGRHDRSSYADRREAAEAERFRRLIHAAARID